MVNINTLIESSHVTINQKDHSSLLYFHHHGAVMCFTILHRTSNICFLPAALQCTHACHFCWKPWLFSSGSKQCYLSQIFLKLNIMSFDLVIKDDITTHILDYNVASKVTWNLLSCKSLHVRKNRLAPALGQNLMGHRVITHSVSSTCWTLMGGFPIWVAGMFPEPPWIYTLMFIMSNRLVSLFVMWDDSLESPIHVFFVNKKIHIIPASIGCLTSSAN